MRKIITKIGILTAVFLMVFSINSHGEELNKNKRVLHEYLEIHGEEIANEYDLNWNLVKAVMFLESRWDKECISYNYDKKGRIVSTDEGLAQINDKLLLWYGELAGLEDPDPFNPIHSIKMCCAGLNFWREYGIKEGYENEELMLVTINSYNAGFDGYMKYIKKYNTMNRAYSNMVFKFKTMLDEYGYILD